MPKRNRQELPRVPAGLHRYSRFIARSASLWRRLGDIESAFLRHDLERQAIREPIYIAGVPRAGSTLLTEFLSNHPAVTSHRYGDFPNVYTPYWRNWLAGRGRSSRLQPVERAHGDRIMITNESPEAVEEVIWMHFFRDLHDPEADHVLDDRTSVPEFERFYTDHIRKLLLVRGRERYLAKGNYNTTRLLYILKLFPDARIIVPVRTPLDQVASLCKQDRLFHRAAREDSRIGRQLEMSGHFEFGPARRPVNIGRPKGQSPIEERWKRGDVVAGWALYWNSVYANLLRQLDQNAGLRSAVRLVHYEPLCRAPEVTLCKLLDHAHLDARPAQRVIEAFSKRISAPDYYQPQFTPEEIEQIEELTRPAASALGYAP